MIGFKIIPSQVTATLYVVICVVCLIKCIKGDLAGFFTFLPYAMFVEVFIRGYTRYIPYLTLQYLFIACFAIMLVRGGRSKRSHSHAFYFLIIYTFLEIANNVYPDKPIIGKAIITNSFALLLPAIWASFNVLKPLLINKLLDNIKVATVMLAGIVFVAHITGKINYGLFSNSDASNGMAPVQLSAYLGLGCILFFLSVMNPEEIKRRYLHMGILSFVATVMVLTFSRGGIYFLGAVAALFVFYNRAKMGNYVRLLLLVPVAIFIYYYVVNQTGGKIVERYGQEGTSSRDVLVGIGLTIFLQHPYFGVGTGNYNTTIVKENLYPVESGAHNEYIRAAAEHGIVGVIFYLGFYILLFFEIQQRRQIQKQYAMYFLALFCLIIIHNGLKISIQPIILMLVIATPSLTYYTRKNVENKEFAATSIA
jgi:O-antigen ligase